MYTSFILSQLSLIIFLDTHEFKKYLENVDYLLPKWRDL